MHLTLTQKKLLKLLSINCRFTNKDIAKALRVSVDTVKYQIQNLIQTNQLGFFNTQFVHVNIGYDSYHHWVRLPATISVEMLLEIPHVNSINSSYGIYNFQILSYAKNKKQLRETMQKIRDLNPLRYTHAKLVAIYKSHSNVIPPINVSVTVPTNKKKFEYKLSDITYAKPDFALRLDLTRTDRQIITVLLREPRASFMQISSETGINHETVRYRIRRFVESGFINNFGLIHDYKRYGLYNTYIVFKKCNLDENAFQRLISTIDTIYYSPKLDGDYDGIIYLLTQDPYELGKSYDLLLKLFLDGGVEFDILFWNDVHKYVQFPEIELR